MTGHDDTEVFLHDEDCPATIALLDALLAKKAARPGGHRGYRFHEHGRWVDWDALDHSGISTTERAYVVIARGCSVLERHGAGPPWARAELKATIDEVLDR